MSRNICIIRVHDNLHSISMDALHQWLRAAYNKLDPEKIDMICHDGLAVELDTLASVIGRLTQAWVDTIGTTLLLRYEIQPILRRDASLPQQMVFIEERDDPIEALQRALDKDAVVMRLDRSTTPQEIHEAFEGIFGERAHAQKKH